MPNLTQSADGLIAEISRSVKSDLYAALSPITKRITDAVADLEKALSGSAAKPAKKAARRGRRLGRPPKAAAQAKPAAKKAAKAAKPAKGAKRAAGKRGPRGALQAELRTIVSKANSPMTLTQMRDEMMKNSDFKKRDPKSLYTQIAQAVKKVPEIQKSGKGYTVKG